MVACIALVYRQKSVVWTLVTLVIGGERWSKKKVLNMHKSSEGDQRSSTFNFKRWITLKNVCTRLAIVSQSLP